MLVLESSIDLYFRLRVHSLFEYGSAKPTIYSKMRHKPATLDGISIGLIQQTSDCVSSFLGTWGANIENCPRIDIKYSSDKQLSDFAHEIMTGGIDCVVLFTALGLRRLDQLVTQSHERERFYNCLRDTTLVAVGTEVLNELNELGVKADIRLGDETQWREILNALEKKFDLLKCHVSIEWTHEIHGLRAGLEARGATVTTLDFLSCQEKGFEFVTPFREACFDELSAVIVTEPIEPVILREIFKHASPSSGHKVDHQSNPIMGEQNSKQFAKIVYVDPLVGELLHRFGWTCHRVFENNAPESWGQQEAESIARLINGDE